MRSPQAGVASAFILCARRRGKDTASRCYNFANGIGPLDMSYLRSAIAILICGGLGTAIAWLLVSPLGFGGLATGLVTAFAAMIAATLLFACGVAVGRALHLFK